MILNVKLKFKTTYLVFKDLLLIDYGSEASFSNTTLLNNNKFYGNKFEKILLTNLRFIVVVFLS